MFRGRLWINPGLQLDYVTENEREQRRRVLAECIWIKKKADEERNNHEPTSPSVHHR